jgi:hypothetical protein
MRAHRLQKASLASMIMNNNLNEMTPASNAVTQQHNIKTPLSIAYLWSRWVCWQLYKEQRGEDEKMKCQSWGTGRGQIKTFHSQRQENPIWQDYVWGWEEEDLRWCQRKREGERRRERRKREGEEKEYIWAWQVIMIACSDGEEEVIWVPRDDRPRGSQAHGQPPDGTLIVTDDQPIFGKLHCESFLLRGKWSVFLHGENRISVWFGKFSIMLSDVKPRRQ